MSDTKKLIAVVGATGHQGGAVVRALQAQMLGLLQAFWLTVASFVVMIPLVLLLKPARGASASELVVAE